MPLIEKQKQSIEKYIKQLTSKLKVHSSIDFLYFLLFDAEKTDPAYDLKNCFFHPENYLIDIITEENPVTYGEVKEYILEVIVTECTKNLFPLYKRTFLDLFYREDWERPFEWRLEINRDEEIDPWQFPELKDKTYKPSIRISGENVSTILNSHTDHHQYIYTQTLYLDVEANYHGSQINYPICLLQSSSLNDFKDNFTSISAKNAYIKTFVSETLKKADEIGTQMTLKQLTNQLNLSDNTVQDINACKFACELATHSYYFNQLVSAQLHILSILNLTANNYENLRWTPAIDLMKQNAITFFEAKKLSKSAKIMIQNSCYFNLLANQSIGLKNFSESSISRILFMLHPHITYLISNNKLSFVAAQKFNLSRKDILFDPEYFEFFKTHEISWSLFEKITLHELPIFIVDSIRRLIVNDVLTFESVINAALDKNNTHVILDLYVNASAFRLQKLMDQNPCQIYGIKDTLQIFISELPESAKTCNLSLSEFKEKILTLFFTKLSDDIQLRLNTQSESNANLAIYQQFYNTILLISKPTYVSSSNMLERITTLAAKNKTILNARDYLDPAREQIASQDAILFSPPQKKRRLNAADDKIFNFCDRLTALAPLNDIGLDNHTLRILPS